MPFGRDGSWLTIVSIRTMMGSRQFPEFRRAYHKVRPSFQLCREFPAERKLPADLSCVPGAFLQKAAKGAAMKNRMNRNTWRESEADMTGDVLAVCTSERRGIQKTNVESAVLVKNHGIEGDAHAGSWHRQVSLISADRIEEFRKKGAVVEYGAFGENLVVEGIDFRTLPVGTWLGCGDVLLEMTQIGKECHTHCAIYHQVGDCIMPREGVFARVLKGGTIRVGDRMAIVPRTEKMPWQAAVITLSDKGARGEREDVSGPAIAKRLEESGYEVIEQFLISDDPELLKHHLIRLCDQRKPDLILTTGGTGFTARDRTPEATLAVSERNAPGIAEAIRAASMKITKHAMLSRAVSVIRGKTLIINLPGSPKACMESMDVFLDAIPHAMDLLRGEAQDCAALRQD